MGGDSTGTGTSQDEVDAWNETRTLYTRLLLNGLKFYQLNKYLHKFQSLGISFLHTATLDRMPPGDGMWPTTPSAIDLIGS